MTKHRNSGFLGGNGLRLKKRTKGSFPMPLFFQKGKKKNEGKKDEKNVIINLP